MRKLSLLILLMCFLVVAAEPTGADEALREANRAARSGEDDRAQQGYEAAAWTSTDPGLVAYNKGRWLAQVGDWRSAEREFQRCLEDREASADRRARALYNWGVCLLNRGQTAQEFRAAVECFRQAADITPPATPFQGDIQQNLELAKLLWMQSRAKEAKPPKAGDVPPEAPPPPEQPSRTPMNQEAGHESTGQRGTPMGDPQPPPSGTTPQETTQKATGVGRKPVLLDPARREPLTAEQARQLLKDSADRIARDRRNTARLVAGPDRPNVRDW